MNERIKLLADEAFAVCGKHSNNYNGPAFSAKFAELIVYECGVALSPMLRDMVSRGQAFDLIKKHFGEEE